jgi:hypothetical protein
MEWFMGNSFIKKPQLPSFCCLVPDLLFGSPQSTPHSRFGMLGNKPGITQRWVRRRQQAVAGHGRLSDASHLGFEKCPGSELDGRHRKQRSDAFKASYRRMPSPQLPGRCRLPRVLSKRSRNSPVLRAGWKPQRWQWVAVVRLWGVSG